MHYCNHYLHRKRLRTRHAPFWRNPSETLGNLGAVEEASDFRILRPLLGLDKQEIIDEARVLGTYDIAAGPELCDALGPDRPTTVADLDRLRRNEKAQGGLVELAEACLISMRIRPLSAV